VENIIRVGSAGALREELELGSVVAGMGASTNSNFINQYELGGTFDPICSYELLAAAVESAKELGVKMTLEHCTEGHLIPETIAASGFPAAVGPTFGGAGKIELENKSFTTPSVLAAVGVQVSIITDSPVIPQQYLPQCAGWAVKAGMDPFAALQAITINPAKHLGVADRVGSLEAGKDGDVVVVDGDVMVSDSRVVAVFINGEKVVG